MRPTIATVLLLVGLASFGMWRVLSGSEDQPFAEGATPPQSAQVSLDHTYSLAVPGGVRAMLAHGVPTAGSSSGQLISLQCTWTSQGTSSQALSVSAEGTSTKAENTVGHFDAPISGRIHVDCDGWGAMFIPDSNDRSVDTSGWALLIALFTLTVGGGLALSEVRLALERARASRPTDEDDEVEGFVDATPIRREDREVGGLDRGDVAP